MFIKQNKFSKHSFFMNLALMQAQKNLGNTRKNPSVGCVIVKDHFIISAGCTSINGRPHAEQNAINHSEVNVKDCDLYVTLEPCSHYSENTSCVKTIIKNKIKSVIFSIKDPDKRSYNQSTRQFKNRDILTINGILATRIRNFYKSYFRYKGNYLPFVTAKMAVSKDFFTNNKKKRWITNEFSRGRVHLMRSRHDCILTSVKTVIEDNPHLTCRINGLEHRSPSRIILDKNLKIPRTSSIVRTARKVRTIIFFNEINKNKIKSMKNYKIKFIKAPLDKNGNLDLEKILMKVKLLGFSRIFLETGLKLTTNFLKYDLIDEFQLFISSYNLGSKGFNSFKKNMKLLFKCKKSNVEKINLFGDKLISYRIK